MNAKKRIKLCRLLSLVIASIVTTSAVMPETISYATEAYTEEEITLSEEEITSSEEVEESASSEEEEGSASSQEGVELVLNEEEEESYSSQEEGELPGKEKREVPTTLVNGDFETGDFTGWTLLDGTPVTNDNNSVGILQDTELYWGNRNIYKQGNYFLSGAEKEAEAGAIRSGSFILGGDGYVSFLIGSASAEGKGCVKLYHKTEYSDDLIKTYINRQWKDPDTGLTLLRIYDKLDEKYKGEELYFVIENGNEPGFSFINADDFRVSMTWEEVQELYLSDIERIRKEEDSYAKHICELYRDVTLYGTTKSIGEGLATGKVALEKYPEGVFDREEGYQIDVEKMIKDAIVVKDQFGITAPFEVSVESIVFGEENQELDTHSFVLQAGKYLVSYTITFESEGNVVKESKTFTINVNEKQEAGQNIVNGGFETGDLTGWTLLDGTAANASNNQVGIVSNEEMYWGTRYIYKNGDYCLRGDSKEGVSGAIRSSSFILGGDGYISFMIGSAAKEGKGCVKLYLENGTEDKLIKTYTNDKWNDPKTGLTLLRVYDKLEEAYIGQELYFVVENGEEAGFSFINVDDFRTSLTREEVIKLQDDTLTEIKDIDDEYKDYIISCYRKNGIINEIVLQEEIPDVIEKYEGIKVNLAEMIASATKMVQSYSLESVKVDIDIRKILFNEKEINEKTDEIVLSEGVYNIAYTRHYGEVTEDKELKIIVNAVDESKHEVLNGGFETGDLSGWEILSEKVWSKDAEGNYKGIMSAETYWGEKLPYNQEGEYHLNGWEITGDERATWRLKSSVFTLAGSGYISVRMGGNAAQIKVYKLDGTLVGAYNQTRFNDTNFPFVGNGGSWADMGTCFLDLHEYIGEPLYIELVDRNIDQGWACAFFDDVKCYYETEPDIENGYDIVTAPIERNDANELVYDEVKLGWTKLDYTANVLQLSFEDEGFVVKNSQGKKESAELNSVLREPEFQDKSVEPYRPAGISGKALNFDGYSNYVSFDETVEGSSLTIDAYILPRAFMWDNPATPNEERIAEVIAGSYDANAKKGFMLGITKHGYLSFRIGTGDEWHSLSSKTNCMVPLYEWSRVTAVFDGKNGKMALYLNGQEVSCKDVTRHSEIVSSGKPIWIGKGSQPVIVADNMFDGTMFPGLMDEISITLTSLTAEEVAKSGKGLPCIAYKDAMAPDSALKNDYYRPTYHAVPPANWMNEPHALFQYKGKWHLFYQTNQGGPFWHNISWGHWVSSDMVNWKYVKEAVVPTEGTVSPDGVWTGNVIYSEDGKPLLLITLGDDSRPVNGSNQHVGLVKAVDYDDPELTEWEIIGYAVAQTKDMGTPGEFRDAQAFGIGDERYMVVGGAENGKGIAHVFKTSAKPLNEWEKNCSNGALNGMNWEYMGNLFGDFYDKNTYKQEYGTVWEMPNLVPLCDASGKKTDKYLFVFSPQHGDNDVWYYIGEFDAEHCRFVPDYAEAKLMDYGNNIFTGPTVYVNPKDGKVYICSIMQENSAGQPVQREVADHMKAGWAFYAGLPRELYLKEDGKSLGIKNIDTASIEGATLAAFQDLTIEEANKKLAGIESDTLKIEFEMEGEASELGFYLKKSANRASKFYITNNSLGLDGASGSYIRNNTVKGVIYVDKCSIEAYIDEAITVSGSKFFQGTGVEVFADGNITCSITVTQMKSIHEKNTENETIPDNKEDYAGNEETKKEEVKNEEIKKESKHNTKNQESVGQETGKQEKSILEESPVPLNDMIIDANGDITVKKEENGKVIQKSEPVTETEKIQEDQSIVSEVEKEIVLDEKESFEKEEKFHEQEMVYEETSEEPMDEKVIDDEKAALAVKGQHSIYFTLFMISVLILIGVISYVGYAVYRKKNSNN